MSMVYIPGLEVGDCCLQPTWRMRVLIMLLLQTHVGDAST